MEINLKATIEVRKQKFNSLKSFADLADLLEVSPNYLNHILHRIPIDKRYTKFSIPKKRKGAYREISSPIRALKFIQHRLKQILENIFEPRCSAHGFIVDKSIVSNAKAHKKKTKLKYVLNIDLQDFFPSIHFGRVRGLFKSKPYNLSHNVADWIARICCFEGGLPQGAPTSPIISNMICNKLDSQLQRLAEKHRCTYTRYADDITFSTSMPRFPSNIAERVAGKVILGSELEKLLDENGFLVNAAKVRLQESTQRQEITGLTVNRFPNVRRKYIRQIRAMLHDWGRNGPAAAEKTHLSKYHNKHRYPDKKPLSFPSIVRGKIEFLGMVRGKNDPIYVRFMTQLAELDETVKFEDVTHMAEKPARIFLSYAREDREQVHEIYNRLKSAGYSPWMDIKDIFGGEDWQEAINRAIEGADLFIAVLSEKSVTKRGIVQKEIKKALDRFEEKLSTDIFIIPLRLQECEPTDSRIKKIHWINYFDPNGWNRLTQSIQESIRRTSE